MSFYEDPQMSTLVLAMMTNGPAAQLPANVVTGYEEEIHRMISTEGLEASAKRLARSLAQQNHYQSGVAYALRHIFNGLPHLGVDPDEYEEVVVWPGVVEDPVKDKEDEKE